MMNIEEPKTTDRAMIKMELRTFLPLIAFLLVISNTATLLITQQDENTEQIEYTNKRHERQNDDVYQEMKHYVDKRFLELQVEELKEKLKEYE